MHQIQIHIVQSQALQALIEIFLHPGMVCAPQLGGDEDILALDTAVECFLEAFSHLVFVAVTVRCQSQLDVSKAPALRTAINVCVSD